jgi:ChpA-C
MRVKRYLAAVSTVAALGLTGLAGTAPAQTTQNGLVNLNVSGNTVQVPISIAANVCGVNVALLANLISTGTTTCNVTATSGATTPVTVGGSGPTTQTGLVNVNISDNIVQVPIAAAVNLCGLNVAILAVLTSTGPASCTATSHSHAGG